jgi:hypothetical protein
MLRPRGIESFGPMLESFFAHRRVLNGSVVGEKEKDVNC